MSGGLFEAACCRKAEVAFALFELEERQFVMLCYALAAFQVISKRFVPGASAVVVTKRRLRHSEIRDKRLRRPRPRSGAIFRCGRRHGRGRGVHRSTAGGLSCAGTGLTARRRFAVPGCAPAAGVIVSLCAVPVGDDPVDALDLTVFAALYHFMHLSVNAVGTLVEHHAEHFAGADGSFIHFANLLGINACGLFTHDMKPVFECEDRKTRMLVGGGVADG